MPCTHCKKPSEPRGIAKTTPSPLSSSLQLRMKASRRMPVTIGGVDCRLLQYSIRGIEEPTAADARSEKRPAADEARVQ